VRTLHQHHIVAGTALVWNTRQDQGGDNADSATTVFRSRRDGVIWALFAQDEWHVSPRLLVSAGVRHDHYDTFGGTTNPRVAVVYRAGAVAAVKLLYGAAFRAPNAYELDYHDGGLSMKTPVGLRPEVVRSYELVFEGVPTPGLHLTASLFALRLRGLVRQVSDPADSLLEFRNLGQARSVGAELEADVRLANGMSAGLSYALQDADDPADDTDLPSAPYHLIRARFSTPVLSERGRVSVIVRRTSTQQAVDGSTVASSTVADITILSHVTRQVNVTGAMYNVFDARYRQPAGNDQVMATVPQTGRTARLGVRLSF